MKTPYKSLFENSTSLRDDLKQSLQKINHSYLYQDDETKISFNLPESIVIEYEKKTYELKNLVWKLESYGDEELYQTLFGNEPIESAVDFKILYKKLRRPLNDSLYIEDSVSDIGLMIMQDEIYLLERTGENKFEGLTPEFKTERFTRD